MRKVYHMVYFIVTEVGGSSPHARGLLTDGEGGTVVGRIIPACPRMRGVYAPWRREVRSRWGSSPLARGLLNRTLGIGQVMGIIPARAGFTRTPRRPCGPRKDHPRSRGVYPTRPARWRTLAGSSPLARGLRSGSRRPVPGRGIIPARAGFTDSNIGRMRAAQDHPRSRGVYIQGRICENRNEGSSPLARGLPRAALEGVAGLRIIPARAGFTGLP